jgi:peptidoglycan-associated lipoprotein
MLTAQSNAIERGQPATLTWQAFNAASLRIEPEVGAVPLAGNRQVTPQASVTYTATATSPCGSQNGVARITVNEPAPKPDEPVKIAEVKKEADKNDTSTGGQRGTGTEPGPGSGGGPRGGTDQTGGLGGSDRFSDGVKNILFDYDKAEIRADQLPQLQADANWLKQHPGVRVIIEGHADERGNQEYNLALGVRRANNVVDYLVSQGLSESRIRSISFGKERPICRDADPDETCHQRNRRAAFQEAR